MGYQAFGCRVYLHGARGRHVGTCVRAWHARRGARRRRTPTTTQILFGLKTHGTRFAWMPAANVRTRASTTGTTAAQRHVVACCLTCLGCCVRGDGNLWSAPCLVPKLARRRRGFVPCRWRWWLHGWVGGSSMRDKAPDSGRLLALEHMQGPCQLGCNQIPLLILRGILLLTVPRLSPYRRRFLLARHTCS